MSYAWALFAHLFAVFLFLMVHGVSAGVALALRRQREPARMQALLDLSFLAVGFTHLTMFLVLATGLLLAWMGNWWRAGWLWASLALFVAVWASMWRFGTKHYDRVRAAVGTKQFYPKKGAPPPPTLPLEQVAPLVGPRRTYALTGFGFAVLAVFLWLMMFKPF